MVNKDKIITTYNGTPIARSLCRYISGKFYKMGEQCFKMSDGKWHRINNGLIDYDHEIKHWALKSGTSLYNGIVNFDDKGQAVFGKFTLNPIKNIEVSLDGYTIHYCISEEIITNDFIEVLSSGVFHKRSNLDLRTKVHTKKQINKKYPFKLNYAFEGHYHLFKNYYDNNFSFNKTSKKFFEELEDTTFGLENETYNGIIPIRFCYKNGLIPLRDGSLRHASVSPFEYTTIPLQGEKGLHTIVQNSKLLEKYCVTDINCSLHIHLGNLPKTKEYGVALYRLLYSIQEEIYAIFPKQYKKTSLFKATGKDYCKPLPSIPFEGNVNKDSDKLFKFYINGSYDWENDEENILCDNGLNSSKHFEIGMPHPQDSSFERKYYMNMRYYWVNLIPFFFNERTTVEFRIHSPSFNSDKLINWLFIINAICKYAKLRSKDISKCGSSSLTLSNILDKIYSTDLSNYLISYVNYRKNLMLEHSSAEDFYGVLDIKEDNLDKWDYPIKSLL